MFSALYLRSSVSKIVFVAVAGFLRVSVVTVWFKTVDSNGSALRLRLKLDSVVNNDDELFVLFNDENNVLLLLILLIGNFAVDRNDELVGVLKRVDGFKEVFRLLDVNVDDVKRLDGLFELSPLKSELVVFKVVDDDRRLEFVNSELVFREVLGFADKSEFVVDNNEDAVDGFFESAICLIAQYCIILVNIISVRSGR